MNKPAACLTTVVQYNALTSAFDKVTQRVGVCRDFAHLGIALCRALGKLRESEDEEGAIVGDPP